ncbi:uracil-DNA glycosylase [Nocardia zapadnayensis]|uniref:uracil-DNA glycosylase n=1 Tax=Nocardia rhamnosiphila TaxID=426716 RepID=UPI002245C634|nr:uracil-DNA glycosylase [Nocardia zapadnayensis]MCX0273712.1 uracil-DNA glycosylase [Nocardia zapadnayensis]
MPQHHGPDIRPVPGTDPATVEYPAIRADRAETIDEVQDALIRCRACPRLVAWREHVGAIKRSAYRDWDYWSKPVPGFGPSDAVVALVGLAPAAHGGNRTGRIFTGDPAGDLLYATLHALGVASRPTATHRGDGQSLHGVRITVPVHCAPPDNQPTTTERNTCRPWLTRELQLLRPTLSVIVALGGFAWRALLPILTDIGWHLPAPRPTFGHGRHILIDDPSTQRGLHLFGCYHPSRRNISTRTLTPAMLHDLLQRALTTATINQSDGRPRCPPSSEDR